MKIQFLGATQTVTGSRYLISHRGTNILVDCGLFQGYKSLRLRNWEPLPFPASEIDAILLTHAHLDHSGYIPRLRSEGFRGRVFCTNATKDLCRLLLPDSGFLQEEEAKFANRHGFSKHRPALPLYTEKEAEQSLELFETISWKTKTRISKYQPDFSFEFHPAGHLFGAASILIEADGKRVLFSGDLGRLMDPLVRAPECSVEADTLVIESTYGNRQHVDSNPQNDLQKIILRTIQRGGTLLIPSFAVGRAQLLLHYIHQLKESKSIPNVPVFLNSPMAIKANEIFCANTSESKMSFEQAHEICATAEAISSVEESIALNERHEPKIIIAASGMATGGRVLHHLKTLAPDSRNTILFAGYQAGGTRGAAITGGATEIKIHGQYWPVRAEVAKLDSMSAHADGRELLNWVQELKTEPKTIFVTHGESEAADELRRRLSETTAADVQVPDYEQIYEF